MESITLRYSLCVYMVYKYYVCLFGSLRWIYAVCNFASRIIKFIHFQDVLNCFLFSSDRVAIGRALDLPVYFGDAGSREVKYSE